MTMLHQRRNGIQDTHHRTARIVSSVAATVIALSCGKHQQQQQQQHQSIREQWAEFNG